MKTIKTAVSLPADLYAKAEKLRKKLGKSRSQMVAEGLAKVVRELEIKDMEKRDNAAYLKNPDTKEELDEARLGNAKAWSHLDEADKDVNWEDYFAPKRDMDR
jgi:metal-responsive CopG/Arc/MetJ family transcriptional regulator